MPIDVIVPAAGESVTSANVGMWHVSNGDQVQAGQVLVTLETDKVSNELEAPAAGTIEILVGEDNEVSIGAVIARIVEAADAAGQVENAQASPATPASPAAGSVSEPASTPEPAPTPAPADPAPSPENAAAPAAQSGSVDIVVPPAGESISSASVALWQKKDGEAVRAGENVVTLETDKVSNELESPADGTLTIIVAEGEEVPIGTVIARVEVGAAGAVSPTSSAAPALPRPEVETSAVSAAAAPPPQANPVASPAPASEPAPVPVAQPAPAPAPAAPAATAETKVDFSLPPLRSDALSQPVSDGKVSRRKMSMLRRKIATQLVSAQQTAAILTTFNELDMSAVMGLRKQVQEEFIKKYDVKLGFMSFFVKAVVQALKDVPSINGTIEGNEVIQNHYYDIGVAIGTDKGLFVPVIRDADQKSFAEIEKDIIAYAGKAREGQITIDDLKGGVFSISNGGTYGSLLSTPILNPPQSGILGMHTIQQRPVAVNGKVEIRPMMYLALSYDHRLVDGKEAVTFLIRIKECLESPERLLLEM